MIRLSPITQTLALSDASTPPHVCLTLSTVCCSSIGGLVDGIIGDVGNTVRQFTRGHPGNGRGDVIHPIGMFGQGHHRVGNLGPGNRRGFFPTHVRTIVRGPGVQTHGFPTHGGAFVPRHGRTFTHGPTFRVGPIHQHAFGPRHGTIIQPGFGGRHVRVFG